MIGRVAGAPVVLSPSFLLAAIVLTAAFTPSVQSATGLGTGAYVVAAVFVVLLFGSVFCHELAHGLVGRARGQQPTAFVLTLWGGHTSFGGAAATPGSTTKTPIMIDISADGQVIGNNTSFGTATDKTLQSLRDWLKATQGFGGEDPVIVRPNSDTKHERIIDVLNACAAAGIKNLTFS